METRQRAKENKNQSIFVTVGTTQFDSLMKTLCESETLKVLQMLGYTKVQMQIGNGEYVPDLGDTKPVKVEYYRFKPSIQEDIRKADLIISHAGAGSCLEALTAGKKLLVVVNEDLMDNHQLELAYQLHKEQHLYYCTCKTLAETLLKEDFSLLKPFQEGKPEVFAEFLDSVLGFT